MAVAEEVKIYVRAQVAQAKQQLRGLQKQSKSTGDSIKSMAMKMVGVGSAAVLAQRAIRVVTQTLRESYQLYKVQEQAEAQLAQTIKTTGQAAGLTSYQLKNMAAALQQQTLYGDEAIINAESLLLTFKSIGKDVFPEATKTVLDMSQALKQDLKSSAIQLGKALNDPIRGVTALRRVGVSFTEQQLKMITAMQQSGNLAGAQAIILNELKSEFGGVAEAAGNTATGAMTKLKNAVNDAKESLGKAVAEGLKPFAEHLASVITLSNNARTSLEEAVKAARNFSPDTSSTQTIEDQIAALKNRKQVIADLLNSGNMIQQGKGLYAAATELKGINALIAKLEEAKQKRAEYIRLGEEAGDDLLMQGMIQKAKIDAELSEQQAKDMAALQEEYAKTKESQVALLRAQIAYFETFKKGPMANAVLKNLNDQLEALTGTAKTAGEAISETLNGYWQEAEKAFSTAAVTSKEYHDEVAKQKEEADRLSERLHRDDLDRIEKEKQARTAAANYAWGQLKDIVSSYYDAELSLAGDNAEKIKKIKHDQAVANRAIALVEIAISTAKAMAEALGAGPIAGPILAGIIGGLGAVLAAKILNTPIPMADGGIVNKPTLALIGERGPEAVVPLGKMGTIVVNHNHFYGLVISERGAARVLTGYQLNDYGSY